MPFNLAQGGCWKRRTLQGQAGDVQARYQNGTRDWRSFTPALTKANGGRMSDVKWCCFVLGLIGNEFSRVHCPPPQLRLTGLHSPEFCRLSPPQTVFDG